MTIHPHNHQSHQAKQDRNARNDWNVIQLIGRLGREPDLHYTPGGKAVTNFSLANNQGYTDSNGQVVQDTLWVTVTCWGSLAEITNTYLKKGRKVLVVGRLRPVRTWTDAHGEQHKSGIEINATEVIFFDDASAAGNDNGPTDRSTDNIEGADIPF